jgi:hypothetical protein
MDDAPPLIPLGASGKLLAEPMTNAVGDHALLVRQGETARALVTGESPNGLAPARERVIVVPLDDDVELRVDGDALAVWLARGSVGGTASVLPGWASALGLLLVIVMLGFAILGSLTFFGWLVRLLG